MKLNTRMLALASAISVTFWYFVSSILFVFMPGGVFGFIVSRVPMNMMSLVLVNAFIFFVAVFLVVWTAAFLYNRLAQ